MTPYQLQTQEHNPPPPLATPPPRVPRDFCRLDANQQHQGHSLEISRGKGGEWVTCLKKKNKKQFNRPNPNCTQTIQLRKQKESKQNPHRPENSLVAHTPATPPPQLLLHTQWEIKGSPEETLYFYPIQSNTSPPPHTRAHTHMRARTRAHTQGTLTAAPCPHGPAPSPAFISTCKRSQRD